MDIHETALAERLRQTDHPLATTEAIQRVIDEVGERGGGTVTVPPGRWTITTLHLRSGLRFHLRRGAVLQAHDDLNDYTPQKRAGENSPNRYHTLVADHCENLTIEGDGEIDGRGERFWEPPLRDLKARGVDISDDLRRMPPHWPEDGPFWRGWKPRINPMIELRYCSDLVIRDVVFRNAPGWGVHPFCCDRVRIDGITIDSHIYGPNTDGIDVNGCRDVMISNCRIVGCDDSIILKATEDARTCERIAVTNCTLKTNCAALGLGAETSCGIRDVSMSNCVVEQALRMIQLEMWTPGFIENVAITNITGRCMVPDEIPQEKVVYCDIQHHGRGPDSPLGSMRGIVISNIVAETKGRCVLTAAEGSCIEDVTLRDIDLSHPKLEDNRELAKICKSHQNSNDCPWGQATNAVVVAENVDRLWLQNIRTRLPKAGGDVPAWHGLAARNLRGSVVDCPHLAGNDGDLDPVALEDCHDVDLRAIGS